MPLFATACNSLAGGLLTRRATQLCLTTSTRFCMLCAAVVLQAKAKAEADSKAKAEADSKAKAEAEVSCALGTVVATCSRCLAQAMPDQIAGQLAVGHFV